MFPSSLRVKQIDSLNEDREFDKSYLKKEAAPFSKLD